MSTWSIEARAGEGLLRMCLTGTVSAADMQALLRSHNAAVDRLKARPYRVLVDIRGLLPLGAEGADLMAEAKRYSAAQPTFQGSAVLADAATKFVALQHRRTSMNTGVEATELITDDEAEAVAHLARVHRGAAAAAPPLPRR